MPAGDEGAEKVATRNTRRPAPPAAEFIDEG